MRLHRGQAWLKELNSLLKELTPLTSFDLPHSVLGILRAVAILYLDIQQLDARSRVPEREEDSLMVPWRNSGLRL